MPLKIVFPLLLVLAATGCAPTPVPEQSSVHWDRQWGFYWTWTRRFQGGCADWTGTRDWVSVDLLVNGQCTTPEGLPELREGINYASSIDDIAVIEIVRRGNACPPQIEASQIAVLRRASVLALSQATTEGERRVISRIAERLQMSNGLIERTTQPGGFRCSLVHVADDAATSDARDAWTAER